MKVALVYDRLNKWGGAERVLLALNKMFPEAPLYTSVYNKNDAKFAEVFEVRTSGLQRFGFAREHNEMLATFMPLAFEEFNFDDFDLVISITSESAKGIITKPGTKHICYCLTPTRYLWSGYDEYFRGAFLKTISYPALKYLRRWDKIASRRPDNFIAISSEVKKRIKTYYDLDSKVIYPPIMVKNYKTKRKKEDYFLLVSRLSRLSYYKKVDLVIDAFNETEMPLKIVGKGPMKDQLKQRAKKNIKFVGEVSDEELQRYYKEARALVFPAFEDFGLVMAEAQYFGLPVIAYGKGGALDIVKDRKTGMFFREQSTESLVKALKSFHESDYNKQDIEQNAEKFAYINFKKDFETYLNKIL